MNNIMKLANGPVMWTIALVTVGIAILESVFIYRRAKKVYCDDRSFNGE